MYAGASGRGGVGGSVFVGGIVGEGNVYNSFNMANIVGGRGGRGGTGGYGIRGWPGGNGGPGGSAFVGGLSGRGFVANSYSVLLSQLTASLSAGGSGGSHNGSGSHSYPGSPGAPGANYLGILAGQATAALNNCFYQINPEITNPIVGTGSIGSSRGFSGTLVLEDGTFLTYNLNAWVQENKTDNYSSWIMQNGYPMPLGDSLLITYTSGADGTIESDVKNFDTPLRLSAETFTHPEPHMVQTGWSLSSDGTAKDYDLGGIFTANQDTTLYPYWEDTRTAPAFNAEYYTWYTANPEAETFTIQSDQEFLAFANITNGAAIAGGIAQTDFTGKTVELAANISFDSYGSRYNNGEGWTPVGTFNGTFDGKNNKVVGLYINRVTADCQALFSALGTDGTIKDLGVEGVQVYGQNYAAGLVGYSQGTITGCYNAVTAVRAHAPLDNVSAYAGGITAFSEKAIYNSYNRGNIQGGTAAGLDFTAGAGSAGIGSSSYAGGIAGKAAGVYNSYNKGTVTGGAGADLSFGEKGGATFVGGILGQGNVYNSFNIADIIGGQGGVCGNADGGSFAGGLVGRGVTANSFSVLLAQLEVPSLDGESGAHYLGLLVGQTTDAPTNSFYLAAQTEWNPAVGTGPADTAISFNEFLMLENETSLLDALNKWVYENGVGQNYSYWKMQDGYPAPDHSAQGFTVTYDKGTANGVSGDVENSLKISGVPLKLTTQTFTRPLNPHMVQTGWSLSVDGVEKDFDLDGTFSIDQTITLYPFWEDSRLFGEVLGAPTLASRTEISFRINEIISSTGQPVVYARSTENSAPADGWQSGTEFTGLSAGVYYVFARTEADGDYKQGAPSLALEVKVGYYNITWNLNGGTWNEDFAPWSDYKINEDKELPETLHKDGHAFRGWFRDEQLAALSPNITKTDRGDKQFYAKWAPNTLTVIYTVDGETTLTETHLFGESFVLYENITPPMKPNNLFLGWHTAGSGSVPSGWKPLSAVTANRLSAQIQTQNTSVLLTAVWLSSQSPKLISTDTQLSIQIETPENYTYEWEQKINNIWTICSTSSIIPIISGETGQEFRCSIYFAGELVNTLYHTIPAPASAGLIAVLIIVPLVLIAAAVLSIYFFVIRPKRLAAASQGGQAKPTSKSDTQVTKTQEAKAEKETASDQNAPNQTSQKKTPKQRSAKTEQQTSPAPKTKSGKKKSTVAGQQ